LNSAKHDFEANLLVRSATFMNEVQKMFESDLEVSKQIPVEEFDGTTIDFTAVDLLEYVA
jgi:hypothetical protein